MAYSERYVSVTGAGLGNGLSEANAWTLAQAVADSTNGTRRNVISGTYTSTGDIAFPAGANEAPIVWRGYTSTIGDLDDQGRNADGTLNTTNFPVFDGTASYNFTAGDYSFFQNLVIQSAENATTLVSSDPSICYRCELINSHASGASVSTYGNGGASYTAGLNECDLHINSSNSSAEIASLDGPRSSVYGCRIWSDNASPPGGQVAVNVVFNGACVSNVIFNVGAAFQSTVGNLFAYNSCFDVASNFLYQNDADGSTVCINNIIYTVGTYAFDGSNGGMLTMISNAIGDATSGRIDTGALGTTLEEINPITLTADPFVDSANEDFRLNATAGGGDLCRRAMRTWFANQKIGAFSGGDVHNLPKLEGML
jgi:hypothetical protein